MIVPSLMGGCAEHVAESPISPPRNRNEDSRVVPIRQDPAGDIRLVAIDVPSNPPGEP